MCPWRNWEAREEKKAREARDASGASWLEAKECGVLTPLLSNIYLHEFDLFMNSLIEKYSN
jgi:hypothetical protein